MLDPGIGYAPRVVLTTSPIGRRASSAEIQSLNIMEEAEGSTMGEGWEAIVMMTSTATMLGLGSTIWRDRACRKVQGGTAVAETRGPEVSNVSKAATALHRRAWETCRRVVAVEGCTAEGSTTVAVMGFRITEAKLVARRIKEEGSTVKGEG